MNGCIYRTKDGECDLYAEGGKYTAFCEMENCAGRKMSNADEIRAMSDEELAVWLAKFTDCGECPVWDEFPHCTTSEESCACRWHEWLKKEVEK